MDATAPLRTTPLSSRHISLGARMVPFAGYSMPLQYAGLVAEHTAVRNAAGIFDVCHMGEMRVKGAQSIEFVNYLVTNDLNRIAVGQAMYSCACYANGTIVDDLIVYRYADDDLLIVCNASNRAKVWGHLQSSVESFSGVHLHDESDDTALLALQGPKALQILGQAEPSLDNVAERLRPFRFMVAQLAGCPITVARTGYTGEDGVEIFCKSSDAETVWDTLLRFGSPLGLLPAGLGCRDTLRLEARLSLYGQELDEETSPLEAGLAWTVKLDKSDFIGKTALVKQSLGSLERRIAGFEMLGRGAARPGYELLDSTGHLVGRCTSGGPSPTLGKAIGLGFLPLAMTEVGTEILVDCRGKSVPARVVQTPFYRRR
jgi:aminomethyltransferase